MTLRLVALDLSLTATGIAWTHNGLGQPQPGARTVRPHRGGHPRLAEIMLEIDDVCLCDPHLVVVEGLYVAHHNNSLQLAELHGLVKQRLWQLGYPYVVVAPGTRAVYACGDGRADKATVLAAAQRRYTGVYLRSNDEADAFVLLAMAADHYGQPLAALPDTHRRALYSVQWPVLRSPVPGDVTGAPSPGAGAQRSVP